MLGIAFILFGFAMMVADHLFGDGGVFQLLGVASPFMGIALALAGTFMNDKK